MTLENISVLMVSTEYPPMPGGVGRYTRNLVLALQRFGDKISVVCNERGDGDFSGLDTLNKENSDVLLRIVKELRPDLVHVQLEHGLYGLNFGSAKNFRMQTNIDKFYEICQVPIITTFHSAYPMRQWTRLVPSNLDNSTHWSNLPNRISSCMLKYSNRVLTYGAFNRANRKKMLRSAACIAFSEYMAKMLSCTGYKVDVIYHGAEPRLITQPSKETSRSNYSLPIDRRIALAVGFATHTKGWDILKEIKIPDNWIVVVNYSRNHHSNENNLEDPLSIHGDGIRDIPYNNNINVNDSHERLFKLNRGFLTDDEMSHLFYASDAVIMPYSVTSGSGVMFDALAHGLPFVATDLGFFKEFARKGLGIAVKRRADEFSEALKVLDTNYPYYKKEVECFRSKLSWDLVAKKHIKLYTVALARRQKNWIIGPKAASKV